MQSVWATIKPGLEVTAKKAPGGWIPEDIYMAIKTGEATLHLISVDKYYRAFIISKKIETYEGTKLLIWVLHGDGKDDLMIDNWDEIKQWAANIGATKIQFQSGRKGWARVAKRLGFEPTMQIYEVEV